MVKYFKDSEVTKLEIDGAVRWICPDCKDHAQTEPDRNDCKNLFYEMKDGKMDVVGQCC